MKLKLKLLWIDDDDPKRFRHDAKMLTRQGWEITWSHTIEDAIANLKKNEYQAVILDQMIHFQANRKKSIWGGCMLFYWLRAQPLDLSDYAGTEENEIQSALDISKPLAGNQKAFVVILTERREKDLKKRLRSIDRNILILGKPTKRGQLESSLEHLV